MSYPGFRHHGASAVRLAAGERGSVLMETVIAIPLYIVLIGGMFWLGDLLLAKHKLVTADRYAAWNAGNRHAGGTGGIKDKIQNTLFAQSKVGDQKVQSIKFGN